MQKLYITILALAVVCTFSITVNIMALSELHTIHDQLQTELDREW